MEEDFVEAYNNMNYSVFDIKKRFNLNNKNYLKIRNNLIVKNKIKEDRHMNYEGAEYIIEIPNGKTIIRKNFNNKQEYYGCYNNKEDARIVVAELKKENWDRAKAKPVMDKYRCKAKNYTKIGNKYYVYKNKNGKRIYYGGFRSEADAQSTVSLLEQIDWDKTKYDNIKVII